MYIVVEFEHRLLFDHHPGHPRIGYREQDEQPDDSIGADVKELDAEGKGKEDAGRET